MIGLVGAMLGLGLSVYGVHILSSQLAEASDFYRMDLKMLTITLAVSMFAALIAGLLPTWRACQVRPAIQLKSQ